MEENFALKQVFLEADTYYGETKIVAIDAYRQRVGVYALIVEDNKLLMLKLSNGKYYFPGGGIEAGETLHQALTREINEELGVQVEIGALLHADNVIYYHDPSGFAAHIVAIFYACSVNSHDFSSELAEERGYILGYEWLSLDALEPNDFLRADWRVLTVLRPKLSNTM
jgi:8-oxo-dGTP pyrophosphatase MutT (NUDIX family)